MDGRGSPAAARSARVRAKGSGAPARTRSGAAPPRPGGPGEAGEGRGAGAGGARGAVVEPRVAARRRLDALGDPAVEVDQARAEQAPVVENAAQMLRALDRARRVRGRRLRVGRRPDAEAVLGAREGVDGRPGAGTEGARARAARPPSAAARAPARPSPRTGAPRAV